MSGALRQATAEPMPMDLLSLLATAESLPAGAPAGAYEVLPGAPEPSLVALPGGNARHALRTTPAWVRVSEGLGRHDVPAGAQCMRQSVSLPADCGLSSCQCLHLLLLLLELLPWEMCHSCSGSLNFLQWGHHTIGGNVNASPCTAADRTGGGF